MHRFQLPAFRKFLVITAYLISNPNRLLKTIRLYNYLKRRYRVTIILTHLYREALYHRRYSVSKNTAACKNRQDCKHQIINIQDGTLRSGGLSDRLKGICTLYAYSKRHNYDFRCYFVHPFDLRKYLVPNAYNWAIEEEDICYDLETTAVYTWEDEKFVSTFFELNADKLQLHIGCNSAECFQGYSNLFHELFRPSEHLLSHLTPHLEELGGEGNFISVSFRFQNLLGEFKEAGSTSLPEQEVENLITKCLLALSDLKEKNSNIEHILVTSDSNLFRERAIKYLPYVYCYILPQEVGHIDYAASGKSKELTGFIDMFLISLSAKAYQVRTPEMYNSDFPRMAAKISEIPYEVITLN